VREAMRCKMPLGNSKCIHSVDGMIRYEDLVIFPLSANGVEGAVIRVDDVTERVRLEQIMVQSEKMLSVGGLAAGMAHEINNPLGGILQGVQNVSRRLMETLPANSRVAEEVGISMEDVQAYMHGRGVPLILDGIRESGLRASRIVANMLNFSRSSDSKRTPFDMATLLDQTLELIDSDYDLKKGYDFKKITIHREYDPSLPPVYCEGNQVQQVFLNLFKNAAEAMAEKDYKDETPHFVLSTAVKDGMAVIKIEDNGPGMASDTCKRVFEPFFTTKPPGKGTGLGLSVSYFIIVDQHGGTMEVFSALGQWTRFVIKLPLAHGEKLPVCENICS